MISFDKFAELVAESIKNNKDTEEDIVEAFRVFDKDGKGFISVQELRYDENDLLVMSVRALVPERNWLCCR